MPTYAYACTSCGHQFDAVQSFSDDALSVCPECGGALRKDRAADRTGVDRDAIARARKIADRLGRFDHMEQHRAGPGGRADRRSGVARP